VAARCPVQISALHVSMLEATALLVRYVLDSCSQGAPSQCRGSAGRRSGWSGCTRVALRRKRTQTSAKRSTCLAALLIACRTTATRSHNPGCATVCGAVWLIWSMHWQRCRHVCEHAALRWRDLQLLHRRLQSHACDTHAPAQQGKPPFAMVHVDSLLCVRPR
jgi:hypothetical protein